MSSNENETTLAMDLAETFINRKYDTAASPKARAVIKDAWIDGYTKGLLRAARITKAILDKAK